MTPLRIAILALVTLASCRTAPVAAPGGVPPPAEPDPGQGKVAATLIPDPKAQPVELGAEEEYTAPQIRPGNPLPEYPPELVPLRLPPHVIVVRFIANEQSMVEQVFESPLGGTTDDQYCPRFEATVRAALRNWTVYPARIRIFRPGPDSDGDGKPDYRIMTAEQVLKSYFDVSFVFEIVDGKGVVRSGKPEP